MLRVNGDRGIRSGSFLRRIKGKEISVQCGFADDQTVLIAEDDTCCVIDRIIGQRGQESLHACLCLVLHNGHIGGLYAVIFRPFDRDTAAERHRGAVCQIPVALHPIPAGVGTCVRRCGDRLGEQVLRRSGAARCHRIVYRAARCCAWLDQLLRLPVIHQPPLRRRRDEAGPLIDHVHGHIFHAHRAGNRRRIGRKAGKLLRIDGILRALRVVHRIRSAHLAAVGSHIVDRQRVRRHLTMAVCTDNPAADIITHCAVGTFGYINDVIFAGFRTITSQRRDLIFSCRDLDAISDFDFSIRYSTSSMHPTSDGRTEFKLIMVRISYKITMDSTFRVNGTSVEYDRSAFTSGASADRGRPHAAITFSYGRNIPAVYRDRTSGFTPAASDPGTSCIRSCVDRSSVYVDHSAIRYVPSADSRCSELCDSINMSAINVDLAVNFGTVASSDTGSIQIAICIQRTFT